MNLVEHTNYPSEVSLLKRENRLLWALLALQFAILIYGGYRNEQVKAHIKPQAVYDACNKGMNK